MHKLYKLNTESLEDVEIFRRFYEELSEGRRHKIDSMRQQKGKLLALGAGVLIDQGLQEYGLREAEVRIAFGENEKPYFPYYAAGGGKENRNVLSVLDIEGKFYEGNWIGDEAGYGFLLHPSGGRNLCGA